VESGNLLDEGSRPEVVVRLEPHTVRVRLVQGTERVLRTVREVMGMLRMDDRTDLVEERRMAHRKERLEVVGLVGQRNQVEDDRSGQQVVVGRHKDCKEDNRLQGVGSNLDIGT